MSAIRTVVVVAAALCLSMAAHAAITVTTSSGGRNVQGACALRDAIVAVNTGLAAGGCPAGHPSDDINLPAGANIVLSETDPDSDSAGLPAIAAGRSIGLYGHGATISRSTAVTCNLDDAIQPGEFRLIENHGGLLLDHVTLAEGCADGPYGPNIGGAVFNDHAMLITDHAVFFHNSAALEGGAVFNVGAFFSLAAVDTTFEGNVAKLGGGALYNLGGPVQVNRSTFVGNAVTSNLGGAVLGSAILNAGALFLFNCTVSGNSEPSAQGHGGTITAISSSLNPRETRIAFSTIVGNTGSGVANYNSTDPINIANSVLGQNSAGDCSNLPPASTHHLGTDVFSDPSCADDDPQHD